MFDMKLYWRIVELEADKNKNKKKSLQIWCCYQERKEKKKITKFKYVSFILMCIN